MARKSLLLPMVSQPARTEANCRVARGADRTWPALDVGGMYRTPGANVTFLEQPYKLGDLRAVMIEGPSREAIELVEVR